MKVLIVEDEESLAQAISASLQREGYQTEIALDGIAGEEQAATGLFDLVILDIMLPGKNGFEILNDVRLVQPDLKIIVLSAKSELPDKLRGLNNGADDYVTKPFHMEELIARVNLQLKKKGSFQEDTLVFEDLELNMKSAQILSVTTGEAIPLSGKEYELLEYFIRHPNQILTREQIYNRVWGWDNEIESNNLEAYLSFIRKKLRLLGVNVQIKAVRGLGYRMGLAS